jgi:pseudouridine-5'-phosphate glycosidase
MSLKHLIRIGEEVRDALAEARPVLALESTVITHGLPYPENLEAARRFESVAREEGVVPATIAILGGAIHVGLVNDSLEQLASARDAAKLNPSNLAAGVASGRPGSTTVASTMLVAQRAGIRVFSTGGIGGVHRDAEQSFDISADLSALARHPVAVISAGAKAILDLPRTVEMLETLGVPVYGYQTDEFPSFYRRESGLAVDARFDDLPAMAKAIETHWNLNANSGGVLVGNPCPADRQLEKGTYDRALEQALAEAARKGVKGRAVTPFLLEAMRQATDGQSVFTNRALLENNVRVGAQLAKLLVRAQHAPEHLWAPHM